MRAPWLQRKEGKKGEVSARQMNELMKYQSRLIIFLPIIKNRNDQQIVSNLRSNVAA